MVYEVTSQPLKDLIVDLRQYMTHNNTKYLLKMYSERRTQKLIYSRIIILL